ncbi:MAG: hypothetical protein ACNYVW_10905 [Methanosarcinales archaeon]
MFDKPHDYTDLYLFICLHLSKGQEEENEFGGSAKGGICELAEKYIAKSPLDAEGFVHVQMMRLEVEAETENITYLADSSG